MVEFVYLIMVLYESYHPEMLEQCFVINGELRVIIMLVKVSCFDYKHLHNYMKLLFSGLLLRILLLVVRTSILDLITPV